MGSIWMKRRIVSLAPKLPRLHEPFSLNESRRRAVEAPLRTFPCPGSGKRACRDAGRCGLGKWDGRRTCLRARRYPRILDPAVDPDRSACRTRKVHHRARRRGSGRCKPDRARPEWKLLADTTVGHIFHFEAGLVKRFDIREG